MGFEVELNPGLWGLTHYPTAPLVITAKVFAYLKALRKFGTQEVNIKQPAGTYLKDKLYLETDGKSLLSLCLPCKGKRERTLLVFQPQRQINDSAQGRGVSCKSILSVQSAMMILIHAQNTNKQKQKHGFLLGLQ